MPKIEIDPPNLRPFGKLPKLPKLVIDIPDELRVRVGSFKIGADLPIGSAYFEFGMKEEK